MICDADSSREFTSTSVEEDDNGLSPGNLLKSGRRFVRTALDVHPAMALAIHPSIQPWHFARYLPPTWLQRCARWSPQDGHPLTLETLLLLFLLLLVVVFLNHNFTKEVCAQNTYYLNDIDRTSQN